jgi:hypothetical protein
MEMESSLRYEVIMQILQYSLKRAYIYRGLVGGGRGQELYKQQMALSKSLYDIYQAKAVDRMKLLPFEAMSSNVLSMLLTRPGLFGLDLNIDQRSRIFRSMMNEQKIAQYAYLMSGQILSALCADADVDFNSAFPMPVGTEELRQKLMQQMNKNGDSGKPKK